MDQGLILDKPVRPWWHRKGPYGIALLIVCLIGAGYVATSFGSSSNAKVDRSFLHNYYSEFCENYSVGRQDVLHGDLCKLDTTEARGPCVVVVRDYYHSLIEKLPDGDKAGDGLICALGRSRARRKARRVEELCSGEEAIFVEKLRQRDCGCYGDPEGPCGQFSHQSSKETYIACIAAFMAHKGQPGDKATCASAKRSNTAVNMYIEGLRTEYGQEKVDEIRKKLKVPK